jgi:hypothetical protein
VVSLGEERVFTAGEAIVWAAALGPSCAARAALVARPLTPPGGLRCAIRRIVESSKARTDFDDAMAAKFLSHPLFSGCTNWPKFERVKRKKRVASGSVNSAVDLENEDGDSPAAKHPTNLLREKELATLLVELKNKG